MATFTKISDDETASVTVNADHKIAKIGKYLYGGFCEHIGRCIYGGLYDPGNPLSDKNGFRKDVIAALQELKVPVMRYPGGNFVESYHWMDGIGPREHRSKRQELAWLTVESNQFGTDEFLQWCEVMGTEPYIALNMGTGTLDEALGWVEYCNSDDDTYYANLRRKNGREKAYKVKFWALGNEVWGPWQVEQNTKEDYAKKAHQWARAIKRLDPSVQLILCGLNGTTAWDYHVLKENLTAEGLIAMHSIHTYTYSDRHLPNVTAPKCAERGIEIASSLIDLARIDNGVPIHIHRPTICFDEWNVWSVGRAPPGQGAEELYTLSDALGVGVWLNVFVRQAKHIGMANIAQSVNVISPLMTSKKGIVKQTTWFPLLLFCKYMHGDTIAANVRCGEYDGPTEPGWIRGTIETPWLDVSATVNEGIISLVVVNIHEERAFECKIGGLKAGKVDVYTVTGENVRVVNTAEKQEVCTKESTWDGKGHYTFPKHSLTMLRWKA